MKQIVLMIIFLMSGTWISAQVQLTSIKNSPVKWKIPIAQREIPGLSGYYLQYGDLAALMDSVGIAEGVIIDSMRYNQITDTLTLYTSSGPYKAYIPVPASGLTSVGLVTGISGTDINVSGSPLISNGNITLNIPTASSSNRGALSSTDWINFNNKIGGSGVQDKIAYFNSTSTLTSNALFHISTPVGGPHVGIGTATPSTGARLHLADGDLFIIGGSNRRFLMGSSVSTGFWGGNRWNTSNQLEIVHSGYNTGYGAQLITSDGYTGIRTLGTAPVTPLDVFSSNTSDNGTYQNWAYSAAPTSYRLLLKQTVTGGNVRYNFSQINAGTPYDNVFVMDRGNVCLGCTDASRKLHVAGEMRVTDLITDTPTKLIAADNDGDFGTANIGTGLTFLSGTLSNSGDLSSTNELQTISTSGTAGNITLSNGGGTLNLNVNDADASPTNELQTLSWSTPNLSISSGNSVTLPVLPTGTSTHTLAYLSGAWTSSSFLKNNSSNTASGNSKRVTINDDISGESWPLSIHTATKFLVNGRVQMNSTSSTAVNSIMGRNNNMEVGIVTIGNNMDLTSGTLKQEHVLGVLARNSSSATFSTSSTPAKLDFNQAMVQVNATANTSNDDIVTVITGYGAYEINCDCQFNAGATATYNFGIYVNGSLNGSLVKQIPMTSGGTHDVQIWGYVASLATTDEIDIRVSTGSGTSGNTIGRCMLALKGL